MTWEIFAIKFCGVSFHPKCIHDNHIKIPSVRVAAKKVIQGNPFCFRLSLGILLKEISKILVKRSSLELLILLLMNTYFISGIRDMLRNCFKPKELIKRPPPLMGLKHTAAFQMT